MSNTFDFEAFKAQAIEQLKAGVPLSGKDGVLAPLLENLLNSALEGEMDSHLENGEREYGNRRNGHMSKQVQTSMGEVTINTPRDRDGTFDPQVVRKREKIHSRRYHRRKVLLDPAADVAALLKSIEHRYSRARL